MTSLNKNFDINFSSLKTGIHEFKYILKDAFFDEFNVERDFENCKIQFDVKLEKSENMMTFFFDHQGSAVMPCGRCTDSVQFNFEGSHRQVVKFGEENYNTDELIVLAPNEYKINIAYLLYEFSILSIPSNIYHEDEENCNQDYLEGISDYLLSEIVQDDEIIEEEDEDEIDPRWNQLKNLKNKNN